MSVRYQTFQFRRGTAAEWTQRNPTLLAGEAGYETDTNRLKFGDGVRAWSALPYVGDLEGSVLSGLAIAKGCILAANDTNTLTAVDGGGSTDKLLLYTASSDTISWTNEIDGGNY
jgi:hypothetical protein